jgi:hypothetical protein
MTHKETAERLRSIADLSSTGGVAKCLLHDIANKLDPPKPEPWTVFWFRWKDSLSEWKLAEANEVGGFDMFGTIIDGSFDDIEWKPARILAPDEVAVKIPPVKKWPISAHAIYIHFVDDTKRNAGEIGCVITHAEAEQMEGEQ